VPQIMKSKINYAGSLFCPFESFLGKVNTVVVYDKKDGKEKRRIYVTPLEAKEDPFKIYRCYKV